MGAAGLGYILAGQVVAAAAAAAAAAAGRRLGRGLGPWDRRTPVGCCPTAEFATVIVCLCVVFGRFDRKQSDQ